MKKIFSILVLSLFIFSCSVQKKITNKQSKIQKETTDFTIAFGSGNNQKKDNLFWQDILDNNADVWIWGGDNIYCDTADMQVLEKCYSKQKNKPAYQNFIKNIDVIGMWDDHDYGLNDGGNEYEQKAASQQLFLDFLDVPKVDKRRIRKGTYSSQTYEIDGQKVKIIILDTRYFRTSLTKDTETRKRYKPNVQGDGTMLGNAQWKWLENELTNSDADYNIINSSIQFLSNKHGFEAWGNMPHEVEKMEELIIKTNAKGVFILSGDRHISEISMKEIGKNKFKLYDFTSSGLTHAYTKFKEEENPYRVSKVVHQKSYGLVKFNFKQKKITFEMWGEDKELLETQTITLK